MEGFLSKTEGPTPNIFFCLGWSSKDNTWEPEENILEPRLIEIFEHESNDE